MADTKQGKETGFDIVLEKSDGKVQPNPAPQNTPMQIPVIFCADHETAKGLLVDLFALTGSLRGIEVGEVDAAKTKILLSNGQQILSMLADIMIRDCKLTEADIQDVMKVFEMPPPQTAAVKER